MTTILQHFLTSMPSYDFRLIRPVPAWTTKDPDGAELQDTKYTAITNQQPNGSCTGRDDNRFSGI